MADLPAATPDPAMQGLRTNNAVISSGMKALLAGGLLAPAVGGGFRLLSNVFDQAKPTPDPALPVSVIPIPVPKKRLKAAGAPDILPERPLLTHGASDLFLFPGAQRAAGRAAAVEEMAGNTPSLAISHPRTSGMLATGLGSLAGASLGAGAIGAGALLNDGHISPGSPLVQYGIPAGALAGSLLGSLASTAWRRKHYAKAQKTLKDKHETLDPNKVRPGNVLASLVSGVHQQGRADAMEGAKTQHAVHDNNPVMTTMEALKYVPVPGMSAGAAVGTTVGSVHNYLKARDRINQMQGAKKAEEVPFAKEDNLTPLGNSLYRTSTEAPKSFLAGHYADHITGLPWMFPAALGLGAAGLYGGYKAVDSLVNRERKQDLKTEVDDAKKELLTELSSGYKSAGRLAELPKLASIRCEQLFGKKAETAVATPAEYQTLSNLGGTGASLGALALAGLMAGGAYAGYSHSQLHDPARVARERMKKQIANQWAVAPPEAIAIPQTYPGA